MSPTPFHRAVNCTDLKDIISIHDPEMKRENPVQARAKIEQYNRAERYTPPYPVYCQRFLLTTNNYIVHCRTKI